MEEKTKKRFTFKKILILALIIFIIFISIYAGLRSLISKGVIPEEEFWQYFGDLSIVLIIGVVATISITYLAIKFLERKKGEDDKETPKDYVGTDQAIKVWKQEFIKNTKIPAYFDYSEEGNIKTENYDDLQIRNEDSFSHPTTGTPLIRFECYAKKGTKKGLSTVFIRLDQGIKHIKENWNLKIKEHTPLELFKDDRSYPLTTPQDENTRLQVFMQHEEQEGAKESDLRRLDSLKIRRMPQQEELPEEDKQHLHENLLIEKAMKISKIQK